MPVSEGHVCTCSSCGAATCEETPGTTDDLLIIAVSAVLLTAGLAAGYLFSLGLIEDLLLLGAAVAAGHRILKSGFYSLLRLRFDMSVLVSLAAVGAFFTGHGEEGAVVLFLYFVAVYLEDRASRRARESIGSLLLLAPETARVRRDGSEVTVHVHDVQVGETVLVRPGEKVPLDGTVAAGVSTVNQAPITGESMPVAKRPGDSAFAGTLNEEGYLEILTTKRDSESTIARIAAWVEEAQQHASPTEAFIERFSRFYTPVIILLAALTAAVPPLLFGLPVLESVYRALILLVIACPCALALSTPVAMVAGITSAARNGVLIKGRDHLEAMADAKVIVFDKTGTLTEGRPEVTDIVGYCGYTEEQVLSIAGTLEARSAHPLARAIVRRAGQKQGEVSDFHSSTGMGVSGRIGDTAYIVGNRQLFSGHTVPDCDRFEREGKTAVLIGTEEGVIGIVGLADRVKGDAKETIAYLRSRGILTVMLSGDTDRVAGAVARELGIDEYHAGLLPDEKVRAVEHLMERHGHVVMVGDGVNDAPALARATVGIAMGAIGSDAAIRTADIVLMDDRLPQVIYTLDLAEKTMAVVKQNTALSIIVKASVAALAFPGLVTLWMAVAVGDMGLSLAVIGNALRITRKRRGVSL